MHKYVLITLVLLLIGIFFYFANFNKKNEQIPDFFWKNKIEDFDNLLK